MTPRHIPRMAGHRPDPESLRLAQSLADKDLSFQCCVVVRQGCFFLTPVAVLKDGEVPIWQTKVRRT